MTSERLPISVLIMTQNEEANIRHALLSVVERFDQVVVADSHSVDRTVAICEEHNGVEVYIHGFLSWADQRNWMLANCAIRNDVVLFLDADESLTPQFIDELAGILRSGRYFDSIYIAVRFIFLGSHLRYAYGHPRMKRVFRKDGLTFCGMGAREYARVEGVALAITSPLVHHDRKPIASWIDKHNRNADREADLYVHKSDADFSFTGSLPAFLRTTIWIRNALWDRLPLMVRPSLYFAYRYIFRLGFLDRRAGFVYCYLHALWYQSLIDIKILETKTRRT